MNSERFEAGMACFAGLASSRKKGWALVDEEMQRQIGAGVCSAEDYAGHFDAMGYTKSWNAYVAWLEEHPGEDVPPEINRITSTLESSKRETKTAVDPSTMPIERWGNEDRWQEFLHQLEQPDTDFARLYVQLVRWKVKEPGFLMRSHGLRGHSLAIRAILGRIQADRDIGKRILRGDDRALHELLRDA